MQTKEEKAGLIKWFSELSHKDISIAGGKGASLAEMYNNKFPIPPGFIVTAQAYQYFIEKSGLKFQIEKIIENLDVEDTKDLENKAKEIRELITNADMPENLKEEILEAYEMLNINKESLSKASSGALAILKNSQEPPFVAVRSSATAEDLVDASFAGQQESFLNIKGNLALIKNIKACFASLFTARAVYYRTKKGFSHINSYLAVVVQKMINSDKSGVIFSVNPVKKDNNIIIEAVWGLGEGIVSGKIKPDSYLVDRESLKTVESNIAEKKIALVRDSSGSNITVSLTEDRSLQQVLTSYEIKRYAQYALQLEEHYKKPQDIEFAIENNELFIVQSRPITTIAQEHETREISGEILLSGLPASPGIISGKVKIILDLSELSKIKKGDILVTKMTNPDMVVTMQKAAAIITDEGGLTSHAAIVSREMGIPAIVGTSKATSVLKDDQIITVDANSGRIFSGKGETKLAEVKPIVQTRTKIKVIVDLPDFAERAALSEAEAIGLTRIEGIIASSGKHPLYYEKAKKLQDYTKVLYAGLKKIITPFKEAWIRTSDIRSDEYKNLEGAPKEAESNPMLGDHGIRFSLKHQGILEAEILAIKAIAKEFPNKILGIMMPQIISVEELKQTKEIAEKISLPDNVKIGIMVETPAAVQIINELCEEGIAFVSFETNDLTQYTLAIDRNNQQVQYIYNEMNQAVLNSLSYVIRVCKKYNVETSICGQAGSKEEMVKFLIKNGIDSISANADAAEKISKLVSNLEKQIPQKEKPIEKIAESNLEAEESQIIPEESQEEPQEKAEDIPIPSEIEVPIPSQSTIQSEDMEQIILKELESDEAIPNIQALQSLFPDPEPSTPSPITKPEPDNPDTEEKTIKENEEIEVKEDDAKEEEEEIYDSQNQYNPSVKKESDTPNLNDSIPIDSEQFNKEEIEVVEINNELDEDTVTDLF